MTLKNALVSAAGNAAADNLYVEDVFSTYLYTGNGSTQTITNGIDLAGEGGLVWIKNRSAAQSHILTDTERGASKFLASNLSGAEIDPGATSVTGFNGNGFSMTYGAGTGANVNSSGYNYASWTFRKAPKFFDIVTWTGDGTGARTISHSLNGTVGALFMKATNVEMQWFSYHNGLTNAQFLELNATTQALSSATVWNNTTPTSSEFTVGSSGNISGRNYVAYLFAHDAGGFGEDGTENVISCGSYTGNGSGSGPTITLGWEPQWILIKRTDSTSNWTLIDNMRGIPTGSDASRLFPNLSNAEITDQETANLLATGFTIRTADAPVNASGGTYIYIAIRRGPMKVPESGTEVFGPVAYTGDGSSNRVIGSLPAGDSALVFTRNYNQYAYPQTWWSRLTGGYGLRPYNTNGEVDQSTTLGWANQIGQLISNGSTNINYGGSPAGNFVLYNFKRAPGFFDVVCYTGTQVNRTLAHNLGVAPELIIQKSRAPDPGAVANYWLVGTNFGATTYRRNWLQLTDAGTNYNYTAGSGFSGQPTASNFYVTNNYNISGTTYVVYLFATLAGVSKVGSYTGTGTTQQIDCGFSGGARFVLIKRTDSTGDWYVWDSARGIVAGNDPYLLLNSTAAEVTNTDYVDTYSAGFEITSTAPAGINANGGTYIFLAIA